MAAILGNTVNYSIGRAHRARGVQRPLPLFQAGLSARAPRSSSLRYGAMAVFLSRFMPIIRTFAPFVAGVGRMPAGRFLAYNLAGALCWVLLFIWGGYLFGNIPFVKDNFGLVTIGIIAAPCCPAAIVLLRRRVRYLKAHRTAPPMAPRSRIASAGTKRECRGSACSGRARTG